MRKNRSLLFFWIALFNVTWSFAQKREINAGGFKLQLFAVDTALNAAFCAVGEMPEFRGGRKRLVKFAKRKIRYPKTAIRDDVQGKVLLEFVIDKEGKVTNKSCQKRPL